LAAGDRSMRLMNICAALDLPVPCSPLQTTAGCGMSGIQAATSHATRAEMRNRYAAEPAVTEGTEYGRANLGSSLRSRATAFGNSRPPRASGPTRTQRARRVGTVPADSPGYACAGAPRGAWLRGVLWVQSTCSPSYVPPLQ
jgi:hypothetical protein